LNPKTYLWVDVIFVRETPKAILIIFDGRKAWIPKSWIYRIKRNKGRHVIASPTKRGEARLPDIDSRAVGQAIFIKISDYNWSKKFA